MSLTSNPAQSVPVITIDGPSASGKGTVSRIVAKSLGWHMLDSGALYRLVAFAAMKHDVSMEDTLALAKVASGLDVQFEITGADDETRVELTIDRGGSADEIVRIQQESDATCVLKLEPWDLICIEQ